ncbi:Adaptive-response sensory-kinase SasA (plasmid) [Pseudoseohaeicola sp. NH-UV-7]|uniref:sensor histidine kinase n=1 Tax=unclassified Sulfitobacter TaxID=196795 RepID=UPI000E0B11E8|nr:cache domain-containing protein [Sulfitobacter sp. JL08]AXI56258.1 two-component sensor histidine kinase [Sulfitobacter sp. JL08]
MLKSVRLRLLVLALLPLIVLLPLMLGVGINRWAARYDALLIANVASDLRIAEQYLRRILDSSETEVEGLAKSVEFNAILSAGGPPVDTLLERARIDLGLDFLHYLPKTAAQTSPWPVVQNVLNGGASSHIDIFSEQDLAQNAPALAEQAKIPLIATQAAVPTDRLVEDRGMVVHTATHVALPGHEGVLVGGTLLNRNLHFIDTINDLVYRESNADGARQGTATLFLEDVRISTNVRLFEDVRALGTRVSAEVRGAVLDQGRTWLDRAFVVNDWYISGYLPILDSHDKRVGMLYVGFLEAPFKAATRSAYWSVLAAFLAIVALTVPLFLRIARGIFAPLERMTKTMREVEEGNLEARIGPVGTRDEIGEVASHLDTLLDQVRDRDQALRNWAEELNTRVEQRTEELRDANKKLETTFQQLVVSEKLASIGEITAGVAHEINNPVAVIQGNVDVMRAALGDKAADLNTEFSLIDRQVQRINAIVGKLLQFARPSEFSGTADSVALDEVIEDCLVLVGYGISQTDTTVIRDFQDAPNVMMDHGELQQVIINLLVNALQAMDGSGVLTLRIKPQSRNDRQGVSVEIKDSGAGIADDILDKVFDPFFTTKPGEGSGLGLSISQTLVQRAGGQIMAQHGSDGGTVFTVWLPSADAPQA